MISEILAFFKGEFPPRVKWEEVKEQILSTLEEERDGLAMIAPFEYDDLLTERKVEVRVNPYYSILAVDSREYYFERETGKFDGTAFTSNND